MVTLTATYELTPDDVGALAYYEANDDSGYKFARRRQAGTLALIVVLIGAVVAALQSSIREAMVPLGISILNAGYLALTHYQRYAARFARYAAGRYRRAEGHGNLGTRTLSVGDTGISIDSDHSHFEMGWSTIARVVCTESHIFAFTGPFNAVIIPRRSLQGASFEEVRDAFLRYGPSVAIAAK